MQFESWIKEQELIEASQYITFEMYCEGLNRLDNITDQWIQDYINENIFTDKVKNIKSVLTGGLSKLFNEIKIFIEKVGDELKLGITEIVKAFKEKSVFNMLKSFGFMFGKMLKCINMFTSLIRKGIFKVFDEMAKTKMFQKIRSGAMKVDELLNRYPILKKLTGLAVAGLLLWMWLNMTFIGDLDYDFNFSDIISAISGNFNIEQLFFSSSGLMLIAMFSLGNFVGISFPWLGKSSFNLMLGIVYTGFVKLKDSKMAFKIKPKLVTQKI
jgi:hypothetical protein